MLARRKAVRHAGDVISHHPQQGSGFIRPGPHHLRTCRKPALHFHRRLNIGIKQLTHHLLRPPRGLHDLRVAIQVLQQKLLERHGFLPHFIAKLQQGAHLAGLVHVAGTGRGQGAPGRVDHVVDLRTEHTADGLVQQATTLRLVAQMREFDQCLAPKIVKQRHLLELLQRNQARAHTVVNVMCVVGNLVRQIAQLCLQAGLAACQKTVTHAERLDRLQPLGIDPRAVLENAFARFKSKVQAIKLRVALFQLINHAQALQVVFEAAMTGHAFIEGILPGVTERRMAQVMRQRNGFHQVFIEPQRTGHRAPQLRHLQRVRETCAKQVALVVEKYLGFVHQTPKRRAVHDAVAVTLELGARRCWRLWMTTAPRPGRITRKDSKHQSPRAPEHRGRCAPQRWRDCRSRRT